MPRKTAPAPLVRPADDPNRYVQCRAMGHEWRHRGRDATRMSTAGARFGAVALISVCSDCKTVRTKWINRRGETVGLDYDRDACPTYARHGEERRSSQEWRSAFATTLFDDAVA